MKKKYIVRWTYNQSAAFNESTAWGDSPEQAVGKVREAVTKRGSNFYLTECVVSLW